jgi:hypothetical protein
MTQVGTEGLPLFGGPLATLPPSGNAQAIGEAGLQRTTEKQAAWLEALVPLAQYLAREQGEITMTDVRKAATEVGLMTGAETPGQLSALGSLGKLAGLRPTGRYKKSDLDSTHARPQMIWSRP